MGIMLCPHVSSNFCWIWEFGGPVYSRVRVRVRMRVRVCVPLQYGSQTYQSVKTCRVYCVSGVLLTYTYPTVWRICHGGIYGHMNSKDPPQIRIFRELINKSCGCTHTYVKACNFAKGIYGYLCNTVWAKHAVQLIDESGMIYHTVSWYSFLSSHVATYSQWLVLS